MWYNVYGRSGSVNDIERKVREIDASMAMEGMPLTEEDKERIRRVINDPESADDICSELVQKHKAKVKHK